MNTFSLQIRVKRTDGGLERILSVARRRRFDVVRMSVDASDNDTYFDVELTVRGTGRTDSGAATRKTGKTSPK